MYERKHKGTIWGKGIYSTREGRDSEPSMSTQVYEEIMRKHIALYGNLKKLKM